MKIQRKNPSKQTSKSKDSYEWIKTKNFIVQVEEGRFDPWGYLIYTVENSKKICSDLANSAITFQN
ncbi:MAG: hypothetical protein RR137_03405 [Odoribacter sp.]